MIVRKILLLVVFASALMLSSRPAFAGLTIGDLNAPGDGLLTIDMDTGLEWLDLTATQGLSWNEALASSFVTSDGFTHATMSEVGTLFTNAGFVTAASVNNPLNDPAANFLLQEMGTTMPSLTVNSQGRGFAVWDINLNNGLPVAPGWTTRPNYHNSGLGSGYALQSLFNNNPDFKDVNSGHFLVRQSVSAVPAPSTFAVWGLLGATVGFGAWWKRR